ncbi:MAG: SDR family NAD(P)-dependent oxidoreductase [Mycobacterium sp.]|uniref:SDR family NAD(P)-dependent oxidoreductase n=1 Tax=Mycobacterium sp. TaxID=1785 RepID=UPI001EBEF04F|nr:SDR family NAD(P)-dependent oxidoreductase [Mycobacterium sp.]MBW0020187.1 SDR family NAD(P)-dependent oxidoreductase [Mycobacterium sp.]
MRSRRRARGLNLRGARVLVTGASSGIGRALAMRLAQEGAAVVLAARRLELLDTLADEIGTAGHRRPVVIRADLNQPGAAEALVGSALQELGGVIDVVINNAGDGMVGAVSVIGDGANARGVFEVNFWAPLAVIAAVVPAMTAAGSGTIVNVTSTMQAIPLPLLGYYASSKAALAQATRSLRLELAETPIRVVEVAPGATDTGSRDQGIGEMPWKTTPPRMLPPVSPQSLAAQIVAALQRGRTRLVYPASSRVPLEVPAIGRLIARAGGRRINTRDALNTHP